MKKNIVIIIESLLLIFFFVFGMTQQIEAEQQREITKEKEQLALERADVIEQLKFKLEECK